MLGNWLKEGYSTLAHLRRLMWQRAPFAVLDQRWTHHGAHSGYQIAEESWAELPRDCRILPIPLTLRIGASLADQEWERRSLLHLMLRAGGTRLVHIVSGDFDRWVYARRPKWLHTKITATFHQPVDKLDRIAARLEPGMLDGIVCVSRDQLPVMEYLVPRGRCVFIPHGVDTAFFGESGGLGSDPRPLLLSVGIHRRDLQTLVETARLIKQRVSEARVVLVGPREYVDPVRRSGIVETISDIDDFELRRLYQRSKMLLMPLEAATANNALLESMAAGRPAVVTDLPALRDYTTPEAAAFCPRGDARAHADAALALLEDASLCHRMGVAAQANARKVSWLNVRRVLREFLRAVCEEEEWQIDAAAK